MTIQELKDGAFSDVMNAIRASDCAMFDSLVSGEFLHYRSEEDNWGWLHFALLGVQHPALAMVAHLIERGIDINSKDIKGYTPLHIAARCKNSKLVKLLLENGADIDAQRSPGMTPIRETILSKPFDIESIKIFIQHGAKIDTAPPNGKSVIELAKILSHGNDKNLFLAFSP